MLNYNVSWLPKLIKYDPKINFDEYYDAIYQYFIQDFYNDRPIFLNKKVGLQKEPLVDGKFQTFSHLTTEETKQGRTVAIDRCERILWNRAIIESDYIGLKIFPEKRSKNRNNILIWFSEIDYLIVLRDAKTYYVFITAYTIKYQHKRKNLQASFEKYIKAETAP